MTLTVVPVMTTVIMAMAIVLNEDTCGGDSSHNGNGVWMVAATLVVMAAVMMCYSACPSMSQCASNTHLIVWNLNSCLKHCDSIELSYEIIILIIKELLISNAIPTLIIFELDVWFYMILDWNNLYSRVIYNIYSSLYVA